MRRRLLSVLAAVLAVAFGAGIALLTTRSLPSGSLETEVTDVTVVAPAPPPPPPTTPKPKPPSPKPKPKPEPEPPRVVDRRCWTMFGGGPKRDLARLSIDLGVPGKRLWALRPDRGGDFNVGYLQVVGSLVVNGWLAEWEDSRPGGFNNPTPGKRPPRTRPPSKRIAKD